MREPRTLREPHFFPLRTGVPHALFADISGFRGVTLRDGKWMANLSGPPTLAVAKEIVRRVGPETPEMRVVRIAARAPASVQESGPPKPLQPGSENWLRSPEGRAKVAEMVANEERPPGWWIVNMRNAGLPVPPEWQ